MEPTQDLSIEYLENEIKKLDSEYTNSLSSIKELKFTPALEDNLKTSNKKITKLLELLKGYIHSNYTRVSANQQSISKLESVQEELEKFRTQLKTFDSNEILTQNKRLEDIEIENRECQKKIAEIKVGIEKIEKFSEEHEKSDYSFKNISDFYSKMISQSNSMMNDIQKRMKEDMINISDRMAQENKILQDQMLDELKTNRAIVNCINTEFQKKIKDSDEEMKKEVNKLKMQVKGFKTEIDEFKTEIRSNFQEALLEMRSLNALNMMTINERYNEIRELVLTLKNS